MKDFVICIGKGSDLKQVVTGLGAAVKTNFWDKPYRFHSLEILPEMQSTLAHPKGEYVVNAMIVLVSDEDLQNPEIQQNDGPLVRHLKAEA